MVTVVSVEGSAPREAGARLIVTVDGFRGTIGGGALEWRALAQAQGQLAGGGPPVLSSHVLGPDLGQCCGGRVRLLTEVFDRSMAEPVRRLAELEAAGPFATHGRIGERVVREAAGHSPGVPVSLTGDLLVERFGEARRTLMLFGAGHVGRAMVLALAGLHFEISWLDTREGAFPAHMPENARARMHANPATAAAAAPGDSFVLVMTHSHALDLDIVAAALRRDLPYVGLIGSASKRARFASRLAQLGLSAASVERLVCPIGVEGIGSKHPAAIAASVAAQLLIRDEALRRPEHGLLPIAAAGA